MSYHERFFYCPMPKKIVLRLLMHSHHGNLIFVAFMNRHRSGRTARGAGQGKVTALVAKRDRVLATAIQQAVLRGDTLDGLSSRKSDYGPGGPRSGTKKVRTTSSRPPRSTAPSRGQNKGTVQRGRRK